MIKNVPKKRSEFWKNFDEALGIQVQPVQRATHKNRNAIKKQQVEHRDIVFIELANGKYHHTTRG